MTKKELLKMKAFQKIVTVLMEDSPTSGYA